jgi:hypothetical protein
MVCDLGIIDILSADDAQKTHKTSVPSRIRNCSRRDLTGSGPIPSVIGASAIDLVGRVGDDYLRRSVSPGAANFLQGRTPAARPFGGT